MFDLFTFPFIFIILSDLPKSTLSSYYNVYRFKNGQNFYNQLSLHIKFPSHDGK